MIINGMNACLFYNYSFVSPPLKVDVLDGPFGSSPTSWSDENLSKDIGSITRLQISSGHIIDAIRVQYGETWGPWHGDNGGGESSTIELKGEKIIKIQGTGSNNHYWYGSVIATIEFHTKKSDNNLYSSFF